MAVENENMLNELRKCELVRNERHILTLKGREDLDRLFGFDVATLTPNKDQICYFAAICYLFGLFGINVSSFSAIPLGFVASFKKNGEFFGTFLSEPTYVSRIILGLCIKTKNIEPSNAAFFDSVLGIMSDNETSLIDKCIKIRNLNKNEIIKNRTKEALEQFDKVNLQNCKDNGIIIEKIVSGSSEIAEDLHAINAYEEAEKKKLKEKGETKNVKIPLDDKILELVGNRRFDSEEDRLNYLQCLKNTKAVHDELFYGYILDSGYYVYVGRNRNQNGKVLNDITRISLLRKLLQSINPQKDHSDINTDIIDILNLCSTDYSADVVYAVFDRIANGKAQSMERITRVPNNKGNKEEVANARNNIGIHYGIDRSGRSK